MADDMESQELEFDAAGRLTDASAEDRLSAATRAGRTELFLFAHGWNNTPDDARKRFERFFETVRDALPKPTRAKVATVGVIWPSIRWPDETDPSESPGGSASLSAGTPSTDDLISILSSTFPAGDQQIALQRLGELLRVQPRDPDALREFQTQLAVLAGAPEATAAEEDHNDESLFTEDPEDVFGAFADVSPTAAATGGGAEAGSAWKRIWHGAREAMRVASYYNMRKRAGTIGEHGLSGVLTRLAANAQVRAHLIGHSFGARLVSFSLLGLPETAEGAASPVKSVLLLQGAFSHYAFADTLSFQPSGGALAGMQRRVDGPLVVTHTKSDLALADFYPKASLLRGQDSAARHDLLTRWAAMGHDGAQEVEAAEAKVGPIGTPYPFTPGQFLNLNCNNLITQGPWPFGSHSDIIHPELGWIAAAAAGLITT